MLKIANNHDIANYLRKLIIDKYSSTRKFCTDYVKTIGGKELDYDKASLISKHLSEVLKANEELNIQDLPVLVDLLEISYEDILSAGKYHGYNAERMSNYRLVFSDDRDVWDKYLSRNDKSFLNSDEYGKTIIDYALEFERFGILKYLLEKGCIWFSSDDPTTYYKSFRAGTNIKAQEISDVDRLDNLLSQSNFLRKRMIVLAIKNNDVKVLKELKARELPPLYDAANYLSTHPDFDEYYDEDILNLIVSANEEVLDYFTEEFEIIADHDYHTFFIFPFINKLSDLLIKNDHPYALKSLERIIEHNENALTKLKGLVNYAVDDLCSEEWQKDMRDLNTKLVKRHIYFRQNHKILTFAYQTIENRIVTNIIDVDLKSNKPEINELILKARDSYRDIINYKTK